ncbi:MAG: ATP-binding protein [Nitrospirota bacterium]|nr:ATP-binding protein [Nitrospirota bacterium]
MKGIWKSIKGRLFLLLFTSTSLLLIAIGLFLYHEVRTTVLGSVDGTLHSKMQVMTGLLHEEHGAIELELSELIQGEYSIPRSGHYYKVMMNGKLLAASPSLVDSGFDLSAGTLEYRDEKTREKVFASVGPDDEPVRVLQYDLKTFGADFSFFVAESLSGSMEIIRTFRNFLLIVIPSGILVVCLTGLWIARHSLLPLEAFSDRIKTITHKTLNERIDTGTETRELTGLADSFNEMLERLQKVFDSEKRLIADASHELKTPVSVIKAECDVVLQKERRGEEYIEAIKTIKEVAENIDAHIKALLSLARLDSGILSPLSFAAVSLNDCIQKTIEMTKPLAEKRRISVTATLEDDITIAGNRDSLAEAFLNILENGVNYNRDNGALEVSVKRKEEKAFVSFKDTGVGIQRENLRRVFDRFYRADSARSEGTGLGLSIARSVIEAHGGEITVESEPGKGSIFTVALPVKQEQ